MPLEELKDEFFSKGGQKDEWDLFLGGGLSYEELVPYVAGETKMDPMEKARQVMAAGRVIEYECYDGRWRSQGKAVIELVAYDDEAASTLRAIHLAASDGYYSYYAEEKLAVDKVVYHLCKCEAKRCGYKPPRGDKREVVHLARWRMVNPSGLLLEGWTKDVAMACIRDLVRKYVPHPIAPPRAPAPVAVLGGAGLDEAVEEGLREGPKRIKPDKKDKEVARESRGSKRSVSQVLQEKAKTAGDRDEQERQRKKRKRKARSSGGHKGKMEKVDRDQDLLSSPSSSDESDSSGESVFQKPPTRGGGDIWKLARKNPGKLLRSGLEEMSRYLADRVGDSRGSMSWDQRRVMAYVNQIMLANHQGGGPGVRNQREAVTLGSAIDLLLDGSLAALGDLLMQRLKALETAMQEQNWQSARHQELISPQSASLTNTGEREMASKTELRMMRLRNATMKGKTAK